MASDKRNISSFSIIVSFIALAMLGCALIAKLPVKLAPSDYLPVITVSFSMPNTSARAVETEATSKIEAAMARVSGVKHISSQSSSSSGAVSISFDRSTDLETARFEVAMTLRQIWGSLPDGMTYPVISVRQIDEDASGPVMVYTVNSGDTPPEIMAYAESEIRPVLSRIPGVAGVVLSGANPMEWRISYDNARMKELGITADRVVAALDSYFDSEYIGVAPVGDGSGDIVQIAIVNAGNDAGENLDLSSIVVANNEGYVITLDKIASVTRCEAPPTSYFRINGLNSIYLNITAEEDANQIELSRKVRACLAELTLPQGYMLDINYDASESISVELDRIYFRTGLTVVILLLFVGLVTLSLRYLLLITISLAINMAIAVVAYYLSGVEIQLYSLAGITISLNLVIDNLIVMAEHITRNRNLKAFTAVLAATMTTIGALSVVFFLDEKTMLSLKDFVIVVIVNLSVSLFTAMFLVPALAGQLKVRQKRTKSGRVKRLSLRMMRAYDSAVRFLSEHKKIVFTAFILAFGTPVFLLPGNLKGDGRAASLYNSTLGSSFYLRNVRPWVDICLGGTLRLFADKVSNGKYGDNAVSEPVLYVRASLPNGATLSQMNAMILKLEAFLSAKTGIRQFQTRIHGPRSATVSIFFKSEYRSIYPYELKSEIISRVQTISGGNWSVSGLRDQGFSNSAIELTGSCCIKMTGYNYDELFSYAEALRDSLLQNKRIKDVQLNSEVVFLRDDYSEFYLAVDSDRLVADSLSLSELYSAISHDFNRNMTVGMVYGSDGAEYIRLSSAESGRDVWGLMNIPLSAGSKTFKLSDYATIKKRQTPPDIVKEDQQYELYLQYDYIGSLQNAQKVLEKTLEKFVPKLPVGYNAVDYNAMLRSFGERSDLHYLLGLIIVIIFFITSILFDSLRQPVAIILVIPVAFIGVFLTFYTFDLKFSKGGFAAFVLLCGITVNAAIYIINEYNSLRRRYPRVSRGKLYGNAFRAKITAILLTVLSTVLGFIPFLIGGTRENFWFPLAAGTIGGLLFSMIAIFFLLPLLIVPKEDAGSSPHSGSGAEASDRASSAGLICQTKKEGH